MDLYAELRGVVDALEGAGIPYALAGGLAVSIYAAPRATQDIDLVVAQADVPGAIEATAALGFRVAGQTMRVAGGRLEIQRLIKIEGQDLLPLDLLIPMDSALAAILAERTPAPWDESRIWVVGIEGLRALKRLRGSSQDRADLDAMGSDPA